MRSDTQRLASIELFVTACVAAGKAKRYAALRDFEETGHSCYDAGYAAGYSQAMDIVAKYITDTKEAL